MTRKVLFEFGEGSQRRRRGDRPISVGVLNRLPTAGGDVDHRLQIARIKAESVRQRACAPSWIAGSISPATASPTTQVVAGRAPSASIAVRKATGDGFNSPRCNGHSARAGRPVRAPPYLSERSPGDSCRRQASDAVKKGDNPEALQLGSRYVNRSVGNGDQAVTLFAAPAQRVSVTPL